jgi:hypothetical protein
MHFDRVGVFGKACAVGILIVLFTEITAKSDVVSAHVPCSYRL